MEILSNYPLPVLERAVSPSRGLASVVQYPNLAKFKKCLDEWAEECWESQQRLERANRKRLPEPPADPEMQARVAKGLNDLVAQLKRGVGPSTQG